MTLLNRASNGTLGTFVVLWRTLRTLGPMPRARLEALCLPGTPPESESAEGPGPSFRREMIPKTVATWSALDLFLESPDQTLRLAQPFDRIAADDIDSLRTSVLHLLLRDENCPTVVEVDEKRSESNRASDFVRVACWALAQDPYQTQGWDQAEALTRAAEQGLFLFKGDGRWNGFIEWAHFTGLSLPTSFDTIFCPARAIRSILTDPSMEDAMPLGKDLPLTDALRILSDRLPVLDGGRYRSEIDEAMTARGFGPRVNVLSGTLSLALLQLAHEESISFRDAAADVASTYSLVGREGRTIRSVSHVRRTIGTINGAGTADTRAR